MGQARSVARTVPTRALALTASAACPSLMLRFSFRVPYWALRCMKQDTHTDSITLRIPVMSCTAVTAVRAFPVQWTSAR